MRLVDTDEVLDKDLFDFKLNSFKISAGSWGTFTGEVQLARGVDDPCDVAATTAQKTSECVSSSWMASVLPESESDSRPLSSLVSKAELLCPAFISVTSPNLSFPKCPDMLCDALCLPSTPSK